MCKVVTQTKQSQAYETATVRSLRTMELSKIAHLLNRIANVEILSRRKIIDTNLMLNNNFDKHKDDSQLFFDFIF